MDYRLRLFVYLLILVFISICVWSSNYRLHGLKIMMAYTTNKQCSTRKKMHSHRYLMYDSAHPQRCKYSIPYGQFLRVRMMCSDDTEFD